MIPIKLSLRDWRTQHVLAAVVVIVLIIGLVVVLATTPRWRHVTVANASRLFALYDSLDYRLQSIRQDDALVPRIDVLTMPSDWDAIATTDERKSGFLRTVLPLVLLANRNTMEDRARVEAMHGELAEGDDIGQSDRAWLKELAARYRIDDQSEDTAALVNALLLRVDAIPPSLALAQAAIESGWGGSRFALEGNALFGQWTWRGEGLRPKAAAQNATYRVASFSNLLDSVEAYMLNLNSQGAYSNFRDLRAAQRAQGKTLDGLSLAPTLVHYSQEGSAYPVKVDNIIRENQLAGLDGALLDIDGNGVIVQTR